MERWTTPKPLRLSIPFADVSRLDLEFVDLHRDDGSFTAFVFLNAGDLPPSAGRDHERFAGSFTIFAPTECWGAEGHCDWEREPVSPFDRRPAHHLTPINVTMDVTETMRKLGNPRDLEVTVHAARRTEPKSSVQVLRFRELRAFAYQRTT
jgi:hypothetical protein